MRMPNWIRGGSSFDRRLRTMSIMSLLEAMKEGAYEEVLGDWCI